MAQYRALSRGQSSDGRWRQPGERFTDEGPKGAWMQEVDKDGKDIDPLDHDGDGKKGGSRRSKQGKSAGQQPNPADQQVTDYSKLSSDELKAEAEKRKIAIDGLNDAQIADALRAADADA